MRYIVALLAFSLAASSGGEARASTNETIDVGDVTRTYVLHVPENLPSSPALVLAFHGHFGTGAGQERLSGFDALSDRDGFIVAYPDGLQRGWNDGRSGERNTADDLGFAKALVDTLGARYRVDRRRVYFTGMSNGGTFSQYAACKLSGTIAAIAAVSGSMPVDDVASCAPQRAISVLEIAGTADPIMPFDGGAIQLLGQTGATVLSFGRTLRFWANNAGCNPTPRTVDLPAIEPTDGTSAERITYPGCRNGSAVVGYKMIGAGHTWPSGPQYFPKNIIGISSDQLRASKTIVDFFLSHPMH